MSSPFEMRMRLYKLNNEIFERRGLSHQREPGGSDRMKEIYLNLGLWRCFGGTPRLSPLMTTSYEVWESPIQHSAAKGYQGKDSRGW